MSDLANQNNLNPYLNTNTNLTGNMVYNDNFNNNFNNNLNDNVNNLFGQQVQWNTQSIPMNNNVQWNNQPINNQMPQVGNNQGYYYPDLNNINSNVQKVEIDNTVHDDLRCDGCRVTPIVGRRYRCLVCDEFDYCESCYTKYKQSHTHAFNSVTKSKLTVYHNVTCDGCGIKPVMKTRHSCNVCSNFDYCDDCYIRNKAIHNHPFSSTCY